VARSADRLRGAPGANRRFGSAVAETARALLAQNAAEWAAALAYYALLSAFPLMLVAASVAALAVDPAWAVERATAVLGEFLPGGGDRVEGIVQGAVASRGRLGLLSGLALLWTGGRALAALTLALNAVCGDDDADDAPRRFLVSLGLSALVGLGFLAALLAGRLVNELWDAVGVLPGATGPAFAVARTAIQAVALLGAFYLVYRLVPGAASTAGRR
jgi:membrane protein